MHFVIFYRHVGVCCPDDIALSGLAGSQIILDLPGGGTDYEDNENTTGNRIFILLKILINALRVYFSEYSFCESVRITF